MRLFREIITGFISLIRGLQITWRNLLRRSVTLQYPDELPTLAPRYRGLHGLTVDPETGIENCIGCQACARICPDKLISMDLEKREGHPGRYPTKFYIDLNPCCFCGLCVEVCPTPMKALIMTANFHMVSGEHKDLVLTKGKLLENGRMELAKSRVYQTEVNAEKKAA
ncbi:MAG: NADH-quinone oxidoreductase subunit I [Armatimonadetes bacterium CG07_land_8_20_14_0_80_59_28]|nr:MAG: NADH-quinone oxidoreductase subunit I [Armatimonadetes bacterium CG07_land_8_20_14_0_80_59_28]PIY42620.1 MAG: NADH-quinone oxidoreductase subunit I [Armatimonadetes bacterium CG_4_10_14_3_um_filter_59_10]PJB73684.1 MAG: NADH-quinone oxidoreductase subunit I [Armatimonadetes bacterium CG_4_9_14_3_um_filter_58_7]